MCACGEYSSFAPAAIFEDRCRDIPAFVRHLKLFTEPERASSRENGGGRDIASLIHFYSLLSPPSDRLVGLPGPLGNPLLRVVCQDALPPPCS